MDSGKKNFLCQTTGLELLCCLGPQKSFQKCAGVILLWLHRSNPNWSNLSAVRQGHVTLFTNRHSFHAQKALQKWIGACAFVWLNCVQFRWLSVFTTTNLLIGLSWSSPVFEQKKKCILRSEEQKICICIMSSFFSKCSFPLFEQTPSFYWALNFFLDNIS